MYERWGWDFFDLQARAQMRSTLGDAAGIAAAAGLNANQLFQDAGAPQGSGVVAWNPETGEMQIDFPYRDPGPWPPWPPPTTAPPE